MSRRHADPSAGAVAVSRHALHALDAQHAAVDAARRAGHGAVLVLEAPGLRWVCASQGEGPCARCFQLWRLHAWNIGFTRAASTPAPPLPAVAEAWVEAGIDAAVEALSTPAAASAEPGRAGAGDQGIAWRIGIDQGTIERHVVLRHPDCTACPPLEDDTAGRAAGLFNADGAGAGHRGTRGARLDTLAATVLPGAVDPRTGLIRRIVHRTAAPLLGMRAATLYPFRDPATVEQGYGRSGRSHEDGIVAALEAIERFAGMRPRGRRTVVRGRYAELHAEALDPAQFILHTPEVRALPGHTLAEYSPDTEYDWVWGYSFRRAGAVLVPLQLAYFGLGPSERIRGGRFVYEISNGCALGASMAEAALHGLLEVIERDAFLASWHTRRTLDVVDASGCDDPFVQAVLARLEAEGLQTVVHDLRCDLPTPAFSVSLLDHERRFGPSLLHAAGAHLDPAAALRAALSEAATFVYRHDAAERAAKTEAGERMLDDPGLVRTMADHAVQCWPERALREKVFARSQAAPLAWSALPKADEVAATPLATLLQGLVDAVLAVAHDVIVVDQSFAPFHARGLRCAKVLAPGLLPMTFGHRHRRLCPARLAKVAAATTGAMPRLREDPHVFP